MSELDVHRMNASQARIALLQRLSSLIADLPRTEVEAAKQSLELGVLLLVEVDASLYTSTRWLSWLPLSLLQLMRLVTQKEKGLHACMNVQIQVQIQIKQLHVLATCQLSAFLFHDVQINLIFWCIYKNY
jgi:hypothetical protein